MKIVIPGGSGQVGAILCRALAADGHEVVVLSRSPRQSGVKAVAWDAKNGRGRGRANSTGADVVINLAGRSVNCRYSAANRREILDSRVDSTRAVGRAIARAARPPRVWLQASTATIYAHTHGPAHDETGPLGGGEPGVPETWRFSVEVAKAWERACDEIPTPLTRKVLLRSAMTMSPDAGGRLRRAAGAGSGAASGGTNGDGRQYVSWIHEADFVDAVSWLIAHEIAGPVNLAAPQPLPNAEFLRGLRRAWGAPFGLPATEWMLALGARVLRTETELILKSRRVAPAKLCESGFAFRYPDWPGAAAELCARWRAKPC